MKNIVLRNVKGCNTAIVMDINYQAKTAPSFLLECDFVLFGENNTATAQTKDGEELFVKWNVKKYIAPKIRHSVKIRNKKIFILKNSKVTTTLNNNVKSIVEYLRNHGYYWVNARQGKANLLKTLGYA